MKWEVFLIGGLLCIASLSVTGCFNPNEGTKTVILTVFHAGSLSGPFAELEELFESKYPNVDVRRESAGSVDTIRKVTDLGKVADVLGSADYSIIESMMVDNDPQYAEYSIQFARNQLVIAYAEKSAYHDEISAYNWYEYFLRKDVNFGFSNPNADPCGYRALMMIQLSELHYNKSSLFEDLVEAHTAISVSEDSVSGTYTITAPENLNPDSAVMIRPKETDLMAQLESGDLDYLIIYRSVAYQHRKSHVEFIDLPSEIDLSSTEFASLYNKIQLVQNSDLPEKTKTVAAKPIVYGITIPTNAVRTTEALEFVRLLLGTEGQSILTDAGQTAIVPARTGQMTKVPTELLSLVSAQP